MGVNEETLLEPQRAQKMGQEGGMGGRSQRQQDRDL